MDNDVTGLIYSFTFLLSPASSDPIYCFVFSSVYKHQGHTIRINMLCSEGREIDGRETHTEGGKKGVWVCGNKRAGVREEEMEEWRERLYLDHKITST